MKNYFASLFADPQVSRAGVSRPVYVGGILYRSIFEASLESGISTVWILNRLKASRGTPVFIRKTAVVEREWVNRVRTLFFEGAQIER